MESEMRLIRVGKAVHDMCNACSMAAPGIECKPKHCSLVDALRNAPTVDAVEVKCNVSDYVYALWEAPVKEKYIIYCAEVKEIRISMRNCRLTTTYILEPIMYRGHRREYRDEDFGVLVFKEEEHAKRKLDGGAGDGR